MSLNEPAYTHLAEFSTHSNLVEKLWDLVAISAEERGCTSSNSSVVVDRHNSKCIEPYNNQSPDHVNNVARATSMYRWATFTMLLFPCTLSAFINPTNFIPLYDVQPLRLQTLRAHQTHLSLRKPLSIPLSRVPNLVPHQLQLDVSGSDANLFRTPVILPKACRLPLGWNSLGIVVAGNVTEAHEREG